MKNDQVIYIRWGRKMLPILKNMKLAGNSRGVCEVKFTPQFVKKHWDSI